jgi:anaerobic carbon-monoxide dehydrogenase iron sulfur subunit
MANQVEPLGLHWDDDACTGCLSCTIVCSERHTGQSAPSRARVRISVDLLTAEHTAAYCRQCRKAACAQACPVEAIQFDPQVRAWLVDEARCTGCGACVEACPFQAIWCDPLTELAIKCDLCQGATRCVEICPSNALSLRGRTEEASDGR